jgi:signal transduction histidine kinase
MIQIVVKDTGHGIPMADKEKLFLPYFSTRKRGTGLGLAIVNRIVADHKGYIHVEDNTPYGASFVIEIPTR